MRRTVNGAATNAKPPAQPAKPTNGVKAAPPGEHTNDSEDLTYLTVKKSAINNPAELAEWSQKKVGLIRRLYLNIKSVTKFLQ